MHIVCVHMFEWNYHFGLLIYICSTKNFDQHTMKRAYAERYFSARMLLNNRQLDCVFVCCRFQRFHHFSLCLTWRAIADWKIVHKTSITCELKTTFLLTLLLLLSHLNNGFAKAIFSYENTTVYAMHKPKENHNNIGKQQ